MTTYIEFLAERVEAEATRERCIKDWCVIHMASEIMIPV